MGSRLRRLVGVALVLAVVAAPGVAEARYKPLRMGDARAYLHRWARVEITDANRITVDRCKRVSYRRVVCWVTWYGSAASDADSDEIKVQAWRWRKIHAAPEFALPDSWVY